MVLGVWVLVAFVYFNLSYDYVRVNNHDQSFAEYLQYVVQVAGSEHRSPREIRELLLVKAEELGLPLRGDQILLGGSGTGLHVTVGYDVDIEIPVFERGLYRKQFQHTAQFKQYAGF
jgi:hypothetical protein